MRLAREGALRLLRQGGDLRAAARRLGLRPGLVYLVATGVPADSTDGLSPEELAREGLLPSAQHLANPPRAAPAHAEQVGAFRHRRAAEDQQMQAAARSREGR